MLINPIILVSQPQSLLVAGVMILAEVASKFLAAWAPGKLFRLPFPDIMVMFGLSVAQAASTLAAITVAYEIKLVDQPTVNGIIAMILFTCIASPWITARWGASMKLEVTSSDSRGKQQLGIFLVFSEREASSSNFRQTVALAQTLAQGKLTETIQQSFLGFFWGRLILSVFFGVSAFIIFLILQVPYALVLAAIAGVFDLIPGIGATLGISLVALILLPQGFWLSLKVLVSCILLQQVEENLLMPRIMQGSININPVVMFFALLVGARIAGLLGIFLSIPIAGVIVSLFEIDEMKGERE
jgi:hypothetical protein